MLQIRNFNKFLQIH